MRRITRLTVAIAALCAWLLVDPVTVQAKTYSADRFDSVVRVQPDGSLDVTETVVFRFERGTFREVFREIPLRRTDGIEVLGAEMDGQPLPPGREVGTVDIQPRRNRLRVVWRFAPVEDASHAFVLRYRVRGAVRQEPTADRLVWRGTPDQHQYAIRESSVSFELPTAPAAPPETRVRRASTPRVNRTSTTVRVHALDVRRNGWIETTLEFPRASIAAVPPQWQQRAARVQAQSGRWIAGAAALAALGFGLLVIGRLGYDSPPGDLARSGEPSHQAHPPDSLDAALAGTLVSNGQSSLQHAIAILFSLAERGELEIRERRGTFGVREFLVTRRGVSPVLRPHEQAALELVFSKQELPGTTVTLSQARSRLAMRMGRFAGAISHELAGARFLDPDRQALRRRYHRLGIWLLVAATAAAGLVVAVMTPEHGSWPMLIPAAIGIVGLAAFIFGGAVTPLSNEGVRRASQWRAYRRHLADVAAGQQPLPALSPQAMLPFAVALGLASPWSKYLKQHGHPVPVWFHAARPDDSYGAFPAFVAAGGAGSSGAGGGGAGAGAAGGGASGAS